MKRRVTWLTFIRNAKRSKPCPDSLTFLFNDLLNYGNFMDGWRKYNSMLKSYNLVNKLKKTKRNEVV